MPYQTNKQCNKPGCYAIVSGIERYCLTHKRTVTYKRIYKDYERLYASARWKKKTIVHLSEHPLCVDCLQEQGRAVEAREVDHIIPISKGGAELDDDNLQSLCKRHHGIKTYNENKNKI